MKLNLIFLGPPGAGKGTLAARAVEFLKIPHISTGAIFRGAIAAGSPLGKKVQAIISGGKLVDDQTTIALVRERLAQADVRGGYILDGFPRTVAQAEALSQFSDVGRAINFDIPDEGVLERLAGRRVCRQCGVNYHAVFNPPRSEGVCDACGGEVCVREDDREEAIRERLKVYREQTAPLIGYYRDHGLLTTIDASPNVETVLANFKAALA